MEKGELAAPVTVLRGVGPVAARRLSRLGVFEVGDLLLHLPRGYQDRRRAEPLAEAHRRERASVLVQVRTRRWIGRRPPRVLEVTVEDGSGRARLLCFGRPFLHSLFEPGRRFWVYGSFRLDRGVLQASSFEVEEAGDEGGASSFERILPVYPLTEGLSQKLMRELVAQALELAGPAFRQDLPAELLGRRGLMGRREALQSVHFPGCWEELERARLRLVYDEYLGEQVELLRSRRRRLSVQRRREAPRGALRRALLERLPFALTGDQQRALAEIERDLLAPSPSARLLQGEVGSGKTLVALLASLSVMESGEQVAYLAPTELLARQQAETAARLLEPLGIGVALLSGGVQGPAREALLRHVASGSVQMLVGTHALLSEDVAYRRLGLAIIDEQHRFGVRQRRALLAKGHHPDLLLMSATPIPRTLALAAFGDLELSEIRELPQGRKPVITHLTREGNEARVYERVRREVAEGGQAYFVYPLIGESDSLQLKDAEGMYETLKTRVFPGLRLALIHSRLPEERKTAAMQAFVAGRVDILVATSVMEVGVDVPGATCLVVENAERFGLSTLHQLRGRVGRGPRQSYAFLVYGRDLTESGVRRLRAIMGTTDGFRLAEQDLEIRGPGEFLGLRQAGYAGSGLADLRKDWDTLLAARADAAEILDRYPDFPGRYPGFPGRGLEPPEGARRAVRSRP